MLLHFPYTLKFFETVLRKKLSESYISVFHVDFVDQITT